jgi:TonB family protein
VTIGALAPVILLPPAWCDLDSGAARAVLEHEAAHVRRRDWLRLWLEELWCACLWFHPLARTLATRLDLTREMVVDREVMARTGDRAAYARALLAFADRPPSPLPVAPLIRHRHLDTRIAALSQEVPMATRPARRLALVAVVLTLTCTAAAARAVPMPGVQGAVPDRQLPVVIHEVKPDYTPEALAAKITGVVVLSAVVERNGTVGAVRVIQSLDTELGLDEAAVSAMKAWRFDPARKGGIPVPVDIAVEMRFTLRD